MGYLNKIELEKILNKHGKVNTIYESGTNEGLQTIVLSEVFQSVITVELDENYYNKAKENLKENKNIIMYHNDTLNILPQVCKYEYEPLAFYLDAHYCKCEPPVNKSEFPLFKELELIKKRFKKDIIIIDDVHTFGLQRNELKLDESIKEWELVTPENLLIYFDKYVLDSEIINDCFIIWLNHE